MKPRTWDLIQKLNSGYTEWIILLIWFELVLIPALLGYSLFVSWILIVGGALWIAAHGISPHDWYHCPLCHHRLFGKKRLARHMIREHPDTWAESRTILSYRDGQCRESSEVTTPGARSRRIEFEYRKGM